MSYVYIIVYIYMQLVMLQLWNIPMIKMAVERWSLRSVLQRESISTLMARAATPAAKSFEAAQKWVQSLFPGCYLLEQAIVTL